MIDNIDYPIVFRENNFKKLNNDIKEIYHGKKLFIVTDKIVYKLYGELMIDVLNDFEVKYIIAKDKSFKTYNKVINQLLKNDFMKTDLLVALGGGTIGDLVGLVAKTIYRGVNYVQVPTTLLAQIDSSVGSKNAIDTKFGKNLVGSFYTPKLVYINPVFLRTLSDEEYNNGFAEALKMALLFDKDFYNKIKVKQKLTFDNVKYLIELKKNVVAQDPFDHGFRRLLNFGHTFGHVIEKTNNYKKFKHGQAISHGMMIAIEIGIKLGHTNPDIYNDVLESLNKKSLLDKSIKPYESYLDDLRFDKKNDENGLNFIILEDIGVARIIIYEEDKDETINNI